MARGGRTRRKTTAKKSLPTTRSVLIPPLSKTLYSRILAHVPEDAKTHSLISRQFREISLPALFASLTVTYVSEDVDYYYYFDEDQGQNPQRVDSNGLYLLFSRKEREDIFAGRYPAIVTLKDFVSFLRSAPHIRRHIRSLHLNARRYYNRHPNMILGDRGPVDDVRSCTATLKTFVVALKLLPNLAHLQLTNFQTAINKYNRAAVLSPQYERFTDNIMFELLKEHFPLKLLRLQVAKLLASTTAIGMCMVLRAPQSFSREQNITSPLMCLTRKG